MRPKSSKTHGRRLTSALIILALAAIGMFAASAVASPDPGPPTSTNPDGPQTANIPYVAWIGEHVRLTVCDPAIATKPAAGEGQFSTFAVEDWSGYQFQPPTPDGAEGKKLGEEFEPGPAAFFESSEAAHATGIGAIHDGCVATDYKSLNPGLARIRVSIKNQKTGEIAFSHQFLVIWLTANAPVLHEAAASASGSEVFQSQLSSTGQSNYAQFLGDPAGDGEFTPSPFTPDSSHLDRGLIQIKVTGSFPIVPGVPLGNILKESSYTLPAAWPTLAKVLASSEEDREPPGSDPGLWDIHGTALEGTTPSKGGGTEGALKELFLRPAFGNYSSGATATIGPFDPQAANETLLSDKKLNADDAPMPALRLDVELAKNKGEGDLGGAGEITGASKAQIYSHNFNGNTPSGAGEAGNLYNPYYGAYIPATDRPGVNEVSGVTGPSPGGDFPGFLNGHPAPYPFWASLFPRDKVSSSSTGCLRRRGATPEQFETPSGYRTQTFYTDERGETYLEYTPSNKFYLNHLPVFKGAEGESEEGKIIKNTNGGCDLKGLFKTVIGESSISATAVYPYEPVDYPAIGSAVPVVKKVRSLWEKEFFSFPKGPGANEGNIRIVVAKAQDIDGRPFANEEVCFHAQQEAGIRVFNGEFEDPNALLHEGTGPFSFSNQVITKGTEGSQFLCLLTNSQGLAAIELENSSFTAVDLTTTYQAESIIRDHPVNFPANEATKKKEAEEQARRESEERAEKLKHEEEARAEAKKHEEEVRAEKLKTEEREAAEKAKHEEEQKAEEKRLKEAMEAEKKQHEEQLKKEEAEKRSAEEIAKKTKEREAEEAANKKAREAEEAANRQKRQEEEAANKQKAKEELEKFEQKLKAEEAAAQKRHAEEEAASKKRHEEEEAAERKQKGEAEKLVSVVPTGGSGSALYTPIPGTAPLTAVPIARVATATPLTRAQKLARALKACRKQSKRKRHACEVKARKAFGPKKKKG